MHRFSIHTLFVAALTVLAVGCGGSDDNDNDGDNNGASAHDQAAKAFPLFASAVQTAFVLGQDNQTAAAHGFTFATSDTGCESSGTYSISGSGVLTDAENPSAGGTYQFTTTFAACTDPSFAVDGSEDETATVSQTTVGDTTTTDERLVFSSAHLGFTLQGKTFTCDSTDAHLHVQVTQTTGQAASQVVSGTGTWCNLAWDNAFVGDYEFVPQAN